GRRSADLILGPRQRLRRSDTERYSIFRRREYPLHVTKTRQDEILISPRTTPERESPFLIRRCQHLAAIGWHLRQCQRRPRLRRYLRRLRVEHGVAEPISEVGWLAAFALRRRRLRLAFRGTGRAGDAHVEVIVVAVHRPDLR